MPAWIKLTLVIATLGFLYHPGIQHHWEIVQNPYFFPFDAGLYVPAYFKFDIDDPVPTTYAKDYVLNSICPVLYKAMLMLATRFMDVRNFQLFMTYMAYGFFVATLGRLGWLLGGALLSFTVMAIVMNAWMFLGLGFIGGAPRMYAFPLMALILYSLVRDHPRLLGICAILGAMLYPPIAIIAGVCFAGWMLLPSFARRGAVSSWSLSRRLTTLCLVALVTLSALAPLFLASQPFGRRMMATDIGNYPEVGTSGNYRRFDQLPYELFGGEWLSYYLGPLYSHSDAIAPKLNIHKRLLGVDLLVPLATIGVLVLIVTIAGLRLLFQSDKTGIGLRSMGFFVVCFALHVISWFAAPLLYIPTRYLMFSLPFIIALVFPWSAYQLISRATHGVAWPHFRNLAFLAMVGVYLMVFGGRGNVAFETGFIVGDTTRPLMNAVAALPKSSIIAGWPRGDIESIEYLTRRNVFLSAATHQVLHLGFVETMRRRMDALMDAYFSVADAPVRRLREEFGVTHLLVDTRHFIDPQRQPDYFAPWRSRIGPRLAAVREKAYVMNQTVQSRAAIHSNRELILLDLSKLP